MIMSITEAEIWHRRQQKLGQMLSKLSHMSEGQSVPLCLTPDSQIDLIIILRV